MTTLQKLEFCVKYLWKVFGYSFYTGTKYDDEYTLCLNQHRYERVDGIDISLNEFQNTNQQAFKFQSDYVAAAEELIKSGIQSLQDPQSDPILLELREQFINENFECTKLNEKYNCLICEKGFCGADFVCKHIKNKHQDIIDMKVTRDFFKSSARDAYFKDETRMENPPIAHSFNQPN